MIQVFGPPWKTTRQLQQALANVPEHGTFRFGADHGINKLQQLQLMAAAQIRTVPFTTDFAEAVQKSLLGDGRELWLGRKLTHTKGRDILTPDRKFWRIRDYWTKFIPSSAEWRYHVFNNLCIARGKKVFIGEAAPDPLIIRARANDYRLLHSPEPPRGLRDFARSMVRACGLLYGACDILVGEDRQFYALEINTAPAMDDYTLRAYVTAIRNNCRGIA